MILFSRSISSVISPINSLYNSTGTSSWARSESANTFIEVSGVFSSCDTLDTNSSLDLSTTRILPSILLKASEISAVSVYVFSQRSSDSYPSFTASMAFVILPNGRTISVDNNTAMIRIIIAIVPMIRSHIFFRSPPLSIILSVETLMSTTPMTCLLLFTGVVTSKNRFFSS